MFDQDILADLPAPQDDEPASLRSDIVDELLDHLQCAFRREVLKDGDEGAAERRVLDRFGDPKKLARRLWRQAMWSRIMGKRILSGLQWLLTLAAVFLAGAVFWQQSQMLTEMNAQQAAESRWRQNLSITLDDLRTRLPASADSVLPQANQQNPFAYDAQDFKWLRGIVNFDAQNQRWIMVYDPSPNANDPYGGRVMLSDHKLLTDIKSGDVVLVEGGVVDLLDPDNQALYRIDKLKRLMPKNEPVISDAGGGSPTSSSSVLPGGFAGQIIVKLVNEADQSPVRNAELLLKGNGREQRLWSYPPVAKDKAEREASGTYIVTNLPPDRYELQVTLADGQTTKQSVVLRDENRCDLTIVCPGPRTKGSLVLTAPPLPDDLIEANYKFVVNVTPSPIDIGGTSWMPSRWRYTSASFDPKTGTLVSLQQYDHSPQNSPQEEAVDLTNARAEDRVVFGLAGPTLLTYGVYSAVRVEYPPDWSLNANAKAVNEILVLSPGENAHAFKLTEDMLEAVRSDAAKLKAFAARNRWGKGPGGYGGVNLPPRKQTLAADPEPLGDRCRLVMKLTTESKDAKALEGARLSLINDENNAVFMTPEGEVGQDNNLNFREDGTQTVRFEPGRYRLYISFPDGRELRESLPLFRAGQERTETIACPPPANKTSVLVTTPPIPEDLARHGLILKATLTPTKQVLEKRTWKNNAGSSKGLVFDPATGQLKSMQELDFSRDAPEDRLIFVPTGPYAFHLSLHKLDADGKTSKEIGKLILPLDDQPPYIAVAGENKWELKVPDEFWEAARMMLKEKKT